MNLRKAVDKFRDIIFYSFIGFLFLVLFSWIFILCLPYYMGREIWQRFDKWYVNK